MSDGKEDIRQKELESVRTALQSIQTLHDEAAVEIGRAGNESLPEACRRVRNTLLLMELKIHNLQAENSYLRNVLNDCCKEDYF